MQRTVAVLLGAIVALSASKDCATPPPPQTCDSNARCVGYREGFNCTCNPGFKGSEGGCVNIDECTEFPDLCAEAESCNDIIGSYNCTCGDIDTECHDEAVCVSDGNGTTSCICNPGFTGDGTSCVDIDECAERIHNCSEDAYCSNGEGCFGCTCFTGYEGNGFVCTDVDECALETHDCALPLTCNNTRGSFACICGDEGECHEEARCEKSGNDTSCVCNPGYVGSGVQCADVDECAAPHDCHKDGKCVNTDGSYNCVCNKGFKGDGKECNGSRPLSMYAGLLLLFAAFAFCLPCIE